MYASLPEPSELENRLQRLAAAFRQDERVLFAYLFGSVARGRAHAASDVDLAVFLADGADPVDTPLELAASATDILGTEAVDLVILNRAPQMLAYRIVQQRRVLCERDRSRRAVFESLAFRKGADFLPRERDMLARRFALGHR